MANGRWKLKIAIVSAGASTYSGLRAPVELAKAFRKRGHSVSFFAPDSSSDSETTEALSRAGISVKLIRGRSIFKQINRLKRALQKDQPDIITAHCFFWQLLAARIAGPPLIWTYYGTQLDALKEYYYPRLPLWVKIANPLTNLFIRLRTQLMVWMADSIVPISMAASEDLERLYGKKSAGTILLGAAPESFTGRKRKAENKNKLTLLSVSRITPYKGFHTIIQVVNRLAEEFPDTTLHIVGSAPIKHYLRYLKSISGKNIRFHLNVADTRLVKLYANADIYITADKYLFFGLPIWEASSMNIPSVAMNHQAASEAVLHGKTGFLANNPAQLTKQLRKLLSDRQLRNRLGSRAKKHADKHSWSATARAYEELFSRTLYSYFHPLLPKMLLSSLPRIDRNSIVNLADLGTGDGMNLRILDKLGYLTRFKEIVAVDKTPSKLQELKEKYPNLKAVKADVTSMDTLPNSHFDLILCTQVIEHIEDQKAAITQIKRILKPGGKLFISSVAKKWYGLYWHRNRQGKIAVHPDHIHEFTSLKEFTKLIESPGLIVEESEETPGNLPILDYIFRLRNVSAGQKSSQEHRDAYLKRPRLISWKQRLTFLPLPGYAIVGAIARKPKKAT